MQKLGKNRFPMQTAKNGFQILNLHPKKRVFKINPFFGGIGNLRYFYP